MTASLTVRELAVKFEHALALKKRVDIPCGGHLYLRVAASGAASWRLRLKSGGKDTSEKIGDYPAMSLKDARNYVSDFLSKQDNLETTQALSPKFSDYSETWLNTFIPDPAAEHTHKNNKRYLNLKSQLNHLHGLGNLCLHEITPTEVDKVLSTANCTRGAKYLAIRALNQLLKSAVIDGLIDKNPCAGMLNTHGTISVKYSRPKVRGFAWVPPSKLGTKFFEPLKNQPDVNRVFYLLDAFTVLRLTSCISIEWAWIQSGRIMVPGEYMKMGRAFNVPVTPYIEALLANWKAACNGKGLVSKFVFPSRSDPSKSKRLQDVQVPVADSTQGEMTIHGLRKSFRTWAAEYMVSSDVAEMALAHAPKNQLIATYNKYDYFRERHEALCLWNEYLCRMLPDQFLTLIRGIDTEQCSKFRRTLEEKENTFSE